MVRGTKRSLSRVFNSKVEKNACIAAKAGIHNRFDIEVIDSVTGHVKLKAQAENVICSSLWTRLPSAYFSYIHYGTGSGTPSVSDTSLFTFLGYGTPSTPSYDWDLDSGWMSAKRSIQLNETTAVGETLTEVGIGYGTTSTTLVTHAMLKDMNGNQISIEKTSTDIINIYATVFVHWEASYSNGYGNFFGYTYGQYFLSMLAGITSLSGSDLTAVLTSGGVFSGWVVFSSSQGLADGAALSVEGGGDTAFVCLPTLSYDSATKTITLSFTRLSVSTGNAAGGIRRIMLQFDSYQTYSGSGGSYTYRRAINPEIALKIGDTWFPGTAIVGEAVGTGDGATTDFNLEFSYVENPTIYVDGIEQTSGVTVETGVPNTYNKMGAFFELLPNKNTNAPYIGSPVNNFIYSVSGTPVSVYYNPHYAKGIVSYYAAYTKVEVSNDLETWYTLNESAAGATKTVPAEYQEYKYWRFTIDRTTSYTYAFTARDLTGNLVHFATAPADGAVITADYTSKTIAKDINHVFDLSVSIVLGEYSV